MQPYLIDLLSKVCIPIIIGVITYTIAKKQINNSGITQFRQKWIDGLRDSISTFIAKAELISMLDTNDNKNYFEHFKELSQMQRKIELMLNPSEDDHNEIIDRMNDIREIIHDEEISVEYLEEELDALIDDLLSAAKIVLKREWNVVKKGK